MSFEDSINIGTLTMTVWPTHVGVLGADGQEPWQYSDYRRSQIRWETVDDAIQGFTTATIYVPVGVFTHLVFTHHPTNVLIYSIQHLDQPFDFRVPGEITLRGITREDFTEMMSS